ncbi:MAG: hypothetical protein J7J98_08765 [candidate division Zixibacteria bacterium]|nr:hypothetical protein [candidate division Zixibacteria bacterium]
MNRNYRVQVALLALVAFMVAANFGCNRSPLDISPADYFAAGVLVQVMDHDDAHASARLWRDDSFVIDGTARLGDTDLPYLEGHLIDSAYQAILHPATNLAGDTVYFVATDSTRFADSILINVVDTFSITDNFEPSNRLLPGGGQVSFWWTAAANAEGYIIATVKAGETYTGVGYSALVTTGQTAGTIPADVFVDPASSVLDTGMYYVYVYAFSGSPDSAQASQWLPTLLPAEFPLNIDQNRFTGRFGTMAVTLHDSVHVTSGR